MSHVTPVKICVLDLHSRSVLSPEKLDIVEPKDVKGRIGKINKSDFHASISDTASFDLQVFSSTLGYHVSGNHRHMCKEMFRDEFPDEFKKNEFWNQTLSQLYVGLSPAQARWLARSDNKLKDAQIDDTMEAVFTVSIA